uniref:Uncharacterized protein n=1 Tax=Sinocyclocheilus rhinocerous TaxID=307959 RepID=A0A673MT92_9TELE
MEMCRNVYSIQIFWIAIKDLIEKLIKRQETISLVVVPANIDIATTEALQMAFRVDSTGQRTLGILTKPDLVDKGMEVTLVRTVNNQVIQLKKGYMIVKCRGRQDIIEKLDLIKKTLPELQKQLEMKLEKTSDDFRALQGDGVPLDELEKSNFLITVKNLNSFTCFYLGHFCQVSKCWCEPFGFNPLCCRGVPTVYACGCIILDFLCILHLFSQAEETLRDEVEQYVRTRRGKELPEFVNSRTFENIVKKHFEELEEPALKTAQRQPVEDFLDDHFQRAEEKIHSQFKMERIVYSQDHLYSSQLETVKQKQSQTVLGHRAFVSADVREMAQHLTAYFTITSDRLANQIPLIVQYHMLDQYISQLQNAMLAMIGRNKPGILLQEDCAVACKRKELKERLGHLRSAGKVLSKFVHSA